MWTTAHEAQFQRLLKRRNAHLASRVLLPSEWARRGWFVLERSLSGKGWMPKLGDDCDYYHPDTGDKREGYVIGYDGRTLIIKDRCGEEQHDFKIRFTRNMMDGE